MAFVSSLPGTALRSSTAEGSARCSVRMSSDNSSKVSANAQSRVSRRKLLSGGTLAAAALILSPAGALADFTVAAAKRSYDRYFPRIEAGLVEAGAVRDALKEGDIVKAKELVEAKTFDVKLRRAMSIYATSFSDSSINEQSRSLLACVDGFYTNIEKAVSSKTKEESIENWNVAAKAFAAYIRVARLSKLKDESLSIDV